MLMNLKKTSTPNYLKYLNKKKILRYVRENDERSRADIALALSISKPTVSSIVDELIEDGWIEEKDSLVASSSGGRKPVHLSFSPDSRLIAGVDIGGTYVEIGILNLNGTILAKDRFETQPALKNNIIRKVGDCILKLLGEINRTPEHVMAVGVGAPGITDTDKGTVLEAPSLGWIDYPLKEAVENELGLPVYIDNDVNVGVLGEQWKGKAKNADHLILITLGTGVGCGIIVNGSLYRGSSFAAGEIGYMVTDKNEANEEYDEIFEGYGFLDSHVGGPSIVKRMKKKLEEPDYHGTYDSENLSAKTIFQLAKDEDPIATEVIKETVDHIAYALVNVVCIFNPQCVILGGGISKSGGWFLPRVKEVLSRHLPLQTEISVTELENVSVIGAGALCLKEHESLLKSEGVM
ncbi:ROK family transcriptional regulator [Alteribacter keqinensis]|uniref:ROK family transcriptional regulator n=2 Tax=Alteribacter keqinensis TaxID=2483800 RepID=A0A3M7TPU9_9BACI|nr:ROK family transcriptional regulator [Alteribacter keqinensis]